MNTGQRLRKLRQERKLTLRELGAILNMSYSNIAMIERGESSMTSDNVKIFADFFNVTTDYLLCKDVEKQNPLDSFTVEILNSTQDLTAEQKQDVLTYIDFLKAKGILKK